MNRLKKCFMPKIKQNNVNKTITPQLQLNENLPTNGANLVSLFESEPVTNTHQLQDEPFEQINSNDSSESPILIEQDHELMDQLFNKPTVLTHTSSRTTNSFDPTTLSELSHDSIAQLINKPTDFTATTIPAQSSSNLSTSPKGLKYNKDEDEEYQLNAYHLKRQQHNQQLKPHMVLRDRTKHGTRHK